MPLPPAVCHVLTARLSSMQAVIRVAPAATVLVSLVTVVPVTSVYLVQTHQIFLLVALVLPIAHQEVSVMALLV